MKKVLTTLCAVFIAGVGVAQEGPYYGDFDKNLVIREGFGTNDKGELNLDRNAEYVMERLEDGTYIKTIEMTKEFLVKDKSTETFNQSDYFYVVQFEGATNSAADCGPRIDPGKMRAFNLDKDTTVTFYARLWQNSDGSIRTQFICDAQRPSIYMSNLYSDEWSGKGIYTFLNRPGEDKIGRYVTPVSSRADGKVELQFRTVGMNFEQQADILDAYNIQKFALANAQTIIGRWQIMYDYPNFKLAYDKVLDQIKNPQLKINGSEVSDISSIVIDNADNGIILGGDVSTTVLYNRGNIDFSKVSTKIFYQIDDMALNSILLSRTIAGTSDGDDDKWSTTAGQDILQGQSLSNGEHNLKIWFETEYLGDILKEDNNGAYYTTTFTINNASNPLENKGTFTNLILTGDWNQDTFNTIIGGNAASITTVDFTEVTGLTELPIIEGLNPNCLFYVNQDVIIPEGTDNVVVFNGETGRAANIVLTEGHNFNNVKSFTADKVSYSRNFMDTGWFTMCLPFNVDKGDVIVEEFTNVEGNEIVFTKAESIEANVPYLAKTENPEVKNFEAMGVEIHSTENLSPVTPVGGYAFCANYQVIDGENAVGLYLMNNAGTAFAKVAEGNPYSSGVPAFRAYFTTTANRQLVIGHDDGGATDVSSTESTDKLIIISNDGSIEIIAGKAQIMNLYALDGRLVRTLELNEGSNFINGLNKGIYIINHQKVVVK